MVGRLGIGRLGGVLARAGKAAGPQAGSGGAAGIGAIAGIVLLLPMEAGVPIPIPADLVMLAVGARVGAGDIPLWAAVLAFEAGAWPEWLPTARQTVAATTARPSWGAVTIQP